MKRRQFITGLGAAAVGGAALAGTAGASDEFLVSLEAGTTFSYLETDGANTEDRFIMGGKTFIHAPLHDGSEYFLFQYTYGLGRFDDVVMVLSPDRELRYLQCTEGTRYDDEIRARMVDRFTGLLERDLFAEPLYEVPWRRVVEPGEFGRMRLGRFTSALDPFYTFDPPTGGRSSDGGRAPRE